MLVAEEAAEIRVLRLQGKGIREIAPRQSFLFACCLNQECYSSIIVALARWGWSARRGFPSSRLRVKSHRH